MFKRKIYNKIKEWKDTSQGKTALLIEGARRIGKSTVVEEFARNEYKSYILIDFSIASNEVKEMFAKEFETNDVWKHFRAVQEGKVYDLDSSLFNMSANFSYSDALEALQPLLYGDE